MKFSRNMDALAMYTNSLHCVSFPNETRSAGLSFGETRKREVRMKQKKEKRITLRVTPEQYETIQAKAETAHMSTGAYVRAAALRHRVVVIDGLKEFTHELKGIGRNVNQLVVLANMGKIQEVQLGETMEALGRIYHQLRELTEQEHR